MKIIYNWDRFTERYPEMAADIGEQFDIPAYFKAVEKAVGGYLLSPTDEKNILDKALKICPKTAAVKGYYYGWKHRN